MIDRPTIATETVRMVSSLPSPSASQPPSPSHSGQTVVVNNSIIPSTTKKKNITNRTTGVNSNIDIGVDADDDEVRIRRRLLNTLGFKLSTACTATDDDDSNHNAISQKKKQKTVEDSIKNSQNVSMLQHEGPRKRVLLNDIHLEREYERQEKQQPQRQRQQEKYFQWNISTQNMLAMMMIHATAANATATPFCMNNEDDEDEDDDDFDDRSNGTTTSFLEMEPPSFALTLPSSQSQSHSQPLPTTTKKKKEQQRAVRFDSTVIVQPITSHRQYSKRIKQTLWASLEELRHMVYRNSLEFSIVEHNDPSQVLEDDDMYIDAATMEKIHPYWIKHHQPHHDLPMQQIEIVTDHDHDHDDSSSSSFMDDDGVAFIADPRNIIDEWLMMIWWWWWMMTIPSYDKLS